VFGRIATRLGQSLFVREERVVHGEYPLVSLDGGCSEDSRGGFGRGFIVLVLGVYYLKAVSVPFFGLVILLFLSSLASGSGGGVSVCALDGHYDRGLRELDDVCWIRDSGCTMR